MSINWDKFDEKPYVKIEAGRPKVLRISEVKQDTTVIQEKTIPCLVFTVKEEDRKVLEQPKDWQVTSKRLIRKLKPFIEDGSLFTRTIEVVKVGEKFDVDYNVKFID